MGLIESAVAFGARYVNAGASGAGRMLDLEWPVGVGAVGLNVQQRGGIIAGTAQNTVAGGPTTVRGLANGTDCINMVSNVATDLQIYDFGNISPIHLITGPTGNVNGAPVNNDRLVTRFLVDMALSGGAIVADNLHDFGMQIAVVTGTTGLVRKDGNQGFAMQLVDAATVNVGLRGSSLLGQNALIDTTKFHTYEFRLYSAQTNQPYVMEAYIDGLLITRLVANSAGFPVSVLSGANVGFRPLIVNFGGVLNGLLVSRVRIIQGPTLQDTL